MFPPPLASDFPAPRDDEPASLRRDIADELADHLQSAFTHELHRTPDESAARQNVLDRFGNPTTVARKLWFDAMQEKIMSQRISLIVSSLVAAACFGVVALSWVMLRDSRAVNAAILAKLESLSGAPADRAAESPRSLDWNQVKVKLVLDEPGGAPAVGYRVAIQGRVYGVDETAYGDGADEAFGTVLEETTGSTGEVDFGLIRYGMYPLRIVTPWGESSVRQFGVRPGQSTTRAIVCPLRPPETGDVTASVDWPDSVRDHKPWLAVGFYVASRKVADGEWVPRQSRGIALLLNDRSELADLHGKLPEFEQGSAGAKYDHHTSLPKDARFMGTVSLPAGTYTLATMYLLSPSQDVKQAWDVVDHDEYRAPEPAVVWGRRARSERGFAGGSGFGGGGGGFFQIAIERDTDNADDDGTGHRFEVHPGERAHWTFKLSDRVTKNLPKGHMRK